jgi:hypothetical protein
MTHTTVARLAVAGVLVAGALAVLSADTLVMRDGRRVRGDLLAVNNGMIEFREVGAYNSDRVLRIRRDEVQRIELDENRPDRYGDRDRSDREGREGFQGRPRGLREREIVVSGDIPWNDTGVEVRAGQVLYFQANGTVWWGPGRKDGPGGEKNSPRNLNRPIPNRPAAALIGKVGDGSRDYFFIGEDQGPIRVRNSGRLFLGVNDDVLRDNRGNFRVVVSY